MPFVRGKTLEGAVGALLPLSKDLMKPKTALPKTDTVVSAFLLDKVRSKKKYSCHPSHFQGLSHRAIPGA